MIDKTEQRDYQRMLLQLVATVLAGSALVQMVVALADHRITWLTYLALTLTAVAYAWRTMAVGRQCAGSAMAPTGLMPLPS